MCNALKLSNLKVFSSFGIRYRLSIMYYTQANVCCGFWGISIKINVMTKHTNHQSTLNCMNIKLYKLENFCHKYMWAIRLLLSLSISVPAENDFREIENGIWNIWSVYSGRQWNLFISMFWCVCIRDKFQSI